MDAPALPRNDSVELAFERRSARARSLASQSSAARDVLCFAAELYRAQGAVAAVVERGCAARVLSGDLSQDLPVFGKSLDMLLSVAVDHGPPILSDAARSRRAAGNVGLLEAFWRNGRSGRNDYLSRALLRPYAEVFSAMGAPPGRPAAGGSCPLCKGLPLICFRQSSSDSDGAQRLLGCALCGHAWQVPRIVCVGCGENRPEQLHGFQSDRHPAARVEACATCRTYVKSIDLTIDARAIPEVDDLVSLSLDVWATEQGYTRLEPGLSGI